MPPPPSNPSARQHFDLLHGFRNRLALNLGADVTRCPQDVRALTSATLAVVSVLVKLLVDAGVITVGQLTAATAQALAGSDGSAWDPEVPTDSLPANDPAHAPARAEGQDDGGDSG